MISILNLLWVIPLSFIIGIITMAWINRDTAYNMFMQGYILCKGMSEDITSLSLHTVFRTIFNNSIDNFINVTGGLIYRVNPYEQLEMIVIENMEQLEKYFSCSVIEMYRDGDYNRLLIKE